MQVEGSRLSSTGLEPRGTCWWYGLVWHQQFGNQLQLVDIEIQGACCARSGKTKEHTGVKTM